MQVVQPITDYFSLSALQFLVMIAICQRLHRYIASSDLNVNVNGDTFTDGGDLILLKQSGIVREIVLLK